MVSWHALLGFPPALANQSASPARPPSSNPQGPTTVRGSPQELRTLLGCLHHLSLVTSLASNADPPYLIKAKGRGIEIMGNSESVRPPTLMRQSSLNNRHKVNDH